MAKKQRYTVTVKGYVPQTHEALVRVRSRNPENAKKLAIELAKQRKVLDVYPTNASADFVWEAADIEVG